MFEVINPAILVAFISTFFVVSITPGMCMTLAMTMGMTIGFRRTLSMMFGELIGVGLVAVSAVIGVATIMLKYPSFFQVLKYGGGLYLAYLGISMWLSKGKMALQIDDSHRVLPSHWSLISQGFITAISNPKGWAFFIALLPPFIDADQPLAIQLSVLVGIILSLEFLCLCIYALSGGVMRRFLQTASNVQLLNRIAGTMMLGVAVWLAFG